MKYPIALFAISFGTLAITSAPGCSMDTAPTGLRATPPGPGATVRFDLSARPLPEIPIPNDIATFPDPTSRTGLRINASLLASTAFERHARESFSEMEGWGTYEPISVQFDKPPSNDGSAAALDLDAIRARMQGDRYAFADDPVYLINLTTGVPMVLDMGNGSLPVTLRDPDRYWPNDPHFASNNLLFEDHEEGKGLTQADYTPALDMDFDGVLDHPNTLGTAQRDGIDNMMNWYERETDTLIMRPLLPLEEKTEYAVVLTDRLKGSDGNSIKSPFPAIHHPTQRSAVARVASILGDSARKNYYGDISGTGLTHVAFAWSFTTQPTVEDMVLLRNGLYGKGPFARFATQFPAKLTAMRAAGTIAGKDQPAGWEKTTDTCGKRSKTPFAVTVNDADVIASFHALYKDGFGYDDGDIAALERDNVNIDHLVVAQYQSPYLQGDPNGQDPDAHFHVNFMTGEGDVHSDTVQAWFAIPKETAKHKQPFPITLWGHGVGGNAPEVMVYAGNFAREGLAGVGLNMPQQGLPDDPSFRIPANIQLSTNCLVPWVDAVLATRAKDRNGDGVQDPAWWWWTMHISNVRDNVRQGMIDEMLFTKILRTFDGKVMSGQDYNNDGKEDLAGDFDGNGVPDVGGPNVGIYASGESLGGIMSEIQGGIDHQITATAPISGGGGLTDIGTRSYGVTESLAQLMSPLVFAVPATDRPQKNGKPRTNCADSQMTVRLLQEDGDSVPEVEVACLDKKDLDLGMTVVVTDLVSHEKHCARTLPGGKFRVPIGATKGDRLDIQVWNAPDAIDSYATCNVNEGAPVGRDIRSFEQKATQYRSNADGSTCPTDACAQFLADFYPVGSPLVAVQDGMGYSRNTPRIRRFFNLGQAGVDPGDPINFAPYYMMRTLKDPDGNVVPPRALLSINTVGDAFVSQSTGFAFARAAGVVPFLPPSAWDLYPEYRDYVMPQALYETYGGKTLNEVYIEAGEVEGVARTARAPAGPACKANFTTANDPKLCKSAPTLDPADCQNALYDADWFSEGKMGFDQQHPKVPVRAARILGMHAGSDLETLEKAWSPRIKGAPFAPDQNAWDASGQLLAVANLYVKPSGQHVWDTKDVCRLWDHAAYGDMMITHFFQTNGKDLYYLSHPSSHQCLQSFACDFLKQ